MMMAVIVDAVAATVLHSFTHSLEKMKPK